jgi:polyhydroxybutyrate depolymerase
MKAKYIYFLVVLQSLIYNSIEAQISSHTFEYDGLTREYDLYVPSIYDGSQSVPIVFNLHGYTSNKEEQTVYGDFRGIADTANFIIVHPNGTFDTSNERWWNAFGIFGGPDDLGFLVALLSEIDQNYNLDLDRVYSTGMSNGGFMSFELACEASSVFTAVASVTGSMALNKPNNCGAVEPVPAMQIHGTNDLVVPYNGNAQVASIEDVVDFWVDQVGANTTPVQNNLTDINSTDGSTVEHYVYSNGVNGSSVEHFKVIDGGHTWPGSIVNLPGSGSTNQDFNASIEIWRFFSQFSKENLADINNPKMDQVRIFPNPSEGNFTVDLPNGNNTILISDAMGRVVATRSSEKDFEDFQLTAGSYIIQVHNQRKVIRKKLVIQ